MGLKVKASGTLKSVFSNMEESIKAATITTINKVTKSAFTEAKRGISKDTGIKQFQISGRAKDGVKSVLKMTKANKNRAVGAVYATGGRIGLGRMGARWDKRKPGASYLTRGGKRRIIPGSFMVNRPGGKLIFKRIPGAAKVVPSRGPYKDRNIKRQPLVKLKGPSIPKVFSRKRVLDPVIQKINDEWGKQMNGALFVQLKRRNKAAVVTRRP